MFSFRFARPVFRTGATALRAPLSQRTYATAVADKLKLSLVLPKEVRYKNLRLPSFPIDALCQRNMLLK